MLKFKSSESLDHGFDMIVISTKAETNTVHEEDSVNMVEEFIQLMRQISKDTINDLKTFIQSTNIWTLLSFPNDSEFSLINSKIIHLYFSIPDRVSAVCKFETDGFFFSRNFASFTEESLVCAFSTGDFSKLKRFVPALEHLEGFAIGKLVKIAGFWDSVNHDLISELSHSAKQSFTASLLKNLLNRNFPSNIFSKIIKKLSYNLRLSNKTIVILFMDQFIGKGLLDYREFARLLAAFSSNDLLISLSREILKVWSNDSWTFRTPFSSQLHYSSCLMIIFNQMTPEMFSSDLEEMLMNGVQTRLDHSDYQIRLMGTCVAEVLNKMHPESENKLDFGLDQSNEIVKHLNECAFLLSDCPVDKPIIVEDTTSIEQNNLQSVSESDSDNDDLKPISSLIKEEAFTPKNSKSPLPRFLPDCLKLLRTNEDAELVEKVLATLKDTFLASSRLSRQLHAASAFNTLLTLNDHFEIKEFDQLRHSSMQHLLVDQVKIVGPELIEGLFKSNKLVLGQKMELLQVACASTQQVFKSGLRNEKLQALPSFSALDYFEQSFLISENQISSKHISKSTTSEFIEHLALPLLVQSVRNFQSFRRNHCMFLEKFLWLQAIVLNFSQNHLTYYQMVERYLDLVHLALSATNTAISGPTSKLIEQIPIQKAILIGVSVVLSSWPASLPVLPYYPRLQEIYGFLDEVANGPGFADDQQLQALGSSVAFSLQNLTDPHNLLQESAEQMTLDLKSVKITHLIPQNVHNTIYK